MKLFFKLILFLFFISNSALAAGYWRIQPDTAPSSNPSSNYRWMSLITCSNSQAIFNTGEFSNYNCNGDNITDITLKGLKIVSEINERGGSISVFHDSKFLGEIEYVNPSLTDYDDIQRAQEKLNNISKCLNLYKLGVHSKVIIQLTGSTFNKYTCSNL